MKLYKENGTSPFGACLPSLLQMPFLIVLYSLIRGLSNVVPKGQTYTNVAGATVKCTQKLGCAAPRYIPTSSQMHQALVSSHGQMHWWFGMDLSSLPFSHHAFPGSASQAVLVLPYLVLIGAAMFLQYYQMKQMNSRNPQAAAANPQMQQMQKFFPIIFGVIYLRVPAGATIYMVISSAMRIGTQEFMFRSGMVTPVVHEREIGATKETKEKEKPPPKAVKKTSGATDGTAAAKATLPPAKSAAKTNGAKTNGRATTNGRKPAAGKKTTNGKAASDEDVEDAPEPKVHPRSRSKRTRKAR
jgi:YidC/Oxa1 family membrane protein insertase